MNLIFRLNASATFWRVAFTAACLFGLFESIQFTAKLEDFTRRADAIVEHQQWLDKRVKEAEELETLLRKAVDRGR